MFSFSRQAPRSSACIQKAAEGISDPHKSLMSTISSTIRTAVGTVCPLDSCQLGTAERCIKEAHKGLVAWVYRDGEAGMDCR